MTVCLALIYTVFVNKNYHQDNLTKYLQVQRRVLDNYFGDTSIDILHKRSIAGMVKNLKDSSSSFEGTPLDTTAAISVENLRESYNRFEEAYLYIANNYPDQDMDLMVEESIKEMLSTLDPHSVYIEPDESEQIQEQFEGRFQGIGIQFNIIQD